MFIIENIKSPVSGSSVRLEWLKEEFFKQIKNCISAVEIKLTVCWYLQYGISIGLRKEWLINSIIDYEELHKMAELLTDADILNGRKPPLFRQGDVVEVIVNAKNINYHKGIIYEMAYHFKEKEWLYYIIENNKKVSKQYYYNDLRLIEKAEL